MGTKLFTFLLVLIFVAATSTALSNERVETSIGYDYSTVITTVNSIQPVFFNVKNDAGSTKELNTSLSGVRARFAENERSWIDYTLEGDSSRNFLINIEPNSPGEKDLKFKTQNQRVGIETNSSIPVLVKERVSSPETAEVSGIAPLNVFLIALLGSFLYFVQL